MYLQEKLRGQLVKVEKSKLRPVLCLMCRYLWIVTLLLIAHSQSLEAQNLIPYRKGTQWGFADEKQRVVIACEYEEAKPFLADLAKVKKQGKWGLIDKEGKLFLPCAYDIIYAASKVGRVVVAVGGDKSGHGGKWGFSPQYKGEEIALEYDLIRESGIENLLAVKKGNYWGAISNLGNIVIPIEYEIERIEDHQLEALALNPLQQSQTFEGDVNSYLKLAFQENYARVRKNGKWGYINQFGNPIIPFEYDFLGELKEGFICAIKSDSSGHKLGFINLQNEWQILPTYEVLPETYKYQYFQNGLAPVLKEGKWGFVDTQNQVVVPFQYGQVQPFAEGRALVSQQNSVLKTDWQVIDLKGKVVFELPKDAKPIDTRFWEGALRIEQPQGIRYLNVLGMPIAKEHFAQAQNFYKGFAQVAIQQEGKLKWGVLNKNGTWAIPPVYDFEGQFYERFLRDSFVASLKGKKGLVNVKNQILIPFEYEDIHLPFYERPEIFFRYGLVAVKKNNQWGYIDFKNKTVISFQFEDAQAFEGDFAKVILQGQEAYINRKGKPFIEK